MVFFMLISWNLIFKTPVDDSGLYYPSYVAMIIVQERGIPINQPGLNGMIERLANVPTIGDVVSIAFKYRLDMKYPQFGDVHPLVN